MQILQEAKPSTKLIAFLFLVLGSAFGLATIHPQPVHAGGYLLDRVRCAVRSIVHEACEKTVPAEPPATQPHTAASGNSGQGAPGTPAAQSPQSNQGVSYTSYEGRASLPPVEIPKEVQVGYSALELPSPRDAIDSTVLTASDYGPYFNTVGPYAVKGAYVAAAGGAPVQRSAEGWKLFGVAWYWWVTGAMVAGALAVFGRNRIKAYAARRP